LFKVHYKSWQNTLVEKLDSHGPVTQAVLNAAASLWKHVTAAMTSSGLGCETQVLLAGWQLLRFHLGEHLLGVLSGHRGDHHAAVSCL